MLSLGSNAPVFSLPDQNGVTRSLNDVKKLVLYFYPRDFTPGCSIELADFAKLYAKFKEKGFEVYGVSDDSIDRHKKFCDAFKSSFPLLSDEEGIVSKSYGAWKNKGIFGEGKGDQGCFFNVMRDFYRRYL